MIDDAEIRDLARTIHAMEPDHTLEYLDRLIETLQRIRAELDTPGRHYAYRCQGCGVPMDEDGLCVPCQAPA